MKYFTYKKNISMDDLYYVQVVFDNGDSIELDKRELIDYEFEFYDKLIWFNSAPTPFVRKGFVKFKIHDYKRKMRTSQTMRLVKEYNCNRKSYIENRCCEDSIICVRFANETPDYKVVSGLFSGKIEDGYLILNANNIWPNAPFESDKHYIDLHSVNKANVDRIRFTFENGDCFDVFKGEILEINLNLDKNLKDDLDDYLRKVLNGYIKIKFDPNINQRDSSLYFNVKYPKTKHFIKRLTEFYKDYKHDIYSLTVWYEHDGIEIKNQEHLALNGSWYGEDKGWYLGWYVGGYCEILDDDVICIRFTNKA